MPPFSDDVTDPPENLVGLFVGSPLSFSDTALRLVTEEIPCITFRRLGCIADLFDLTPSVVSNVRLIIVDEKMLEDLQKALPRLRRRFPHVRLVLAYRDRSAALRLIADVTLHPGSEEIGFLPMRVEIDRWLSALRLLVWGERYVPADLIAFAHLPLGPVARSTAPANDGAPATDGGSADDIKLTKRECQVLRSAAEGKQNKIIAEDLGLSEHTIKLHMHHIIAKLGVTNRTEATLWYLSNKPYATGRRQ
ncbi:MAG TPA: response regulator transcription factor [Roseovarius sp.]